MGAFDGTHIVITGGGSGIGLELARQFVRLGALAVSLLDISDSTGMIPDLLRSRLDPAVSRPTALTSQSTIRHAFLHHQVTKCPAVQ